MQALTSCKFPMLRTINLCKFYYNLASNKINIMSCFQLAKKNWPKISRIDLSNLSLMSEMNEKNKAMR